MEEGGGGEGKRGTGRRGGEKRNKSKAILSLSFTHLARGLVVREVGLVEGLLLDDLRLMVSGRSGDKVWRKEKEREREREVRGSRDRRGVDGSASLPSRDSPPPPLLFD